MNEDAARLARLAQVAEAASLRPLAALAAARRRAEALGRRCAALEEMLRTQADDGTVDLVRRALWRQGRRRALEAARQDLASARRDEEGARREAALAFGRTEALDRLQAKARRLRDEAEDRRSQLENAPR